MLSASQQPRLAQLQSIEQQATRLRQDHHVQLASLMKAIQTQELFKAKGFMSFGAYTTAHHVIFSVSRSMAYRLLNAATAFAALKGHPCAPTSERQVRGRELQLPLHILCSLKAPLQAGATL